MIYSDVRMNNEKLQPKNEAGKRFSPRTTDELKCIKMRPSTFPKQGSGGINQNGSGTNTQNSKTNQAFKRDQHDIWT